MKAHTPDEQTAITADINDRTPGTAHGTYRYGDHLRDERADREWDELEAITPTPKAEHPTQDAIVIACPHGLEDDTACRRCMDVLAGSAAPVIAATKARKDAA